MGGPITWRRVKLAMERILSRDEGTFIETEAYVQHRSVIGTMHLNRPLGDGVVTGHGKIGGRALILFAQEPGIFGGSMGEMHARRIASAVDLANRTMRPIVAIWDGEGQRVEDGVPALGATGEMLDSLANCSADTNHIGHYRDCCRSQRSCCGTIRFRDSRIRTWQDVHEESVVNSGDCIR